MNESKRKELESQYEEMRLYRLFGDSNQKKQAEKDIKQFEKEHPDISDDVYFRARTEY